MLRAYYGKSIADFIQEDNQRILGELSEKHQNNKLEILQKNAWKQQITILKSQLSGLNGYIYFEFLIPRMGKRVDNIVILGDKIFLLEFKIGSEQYDRHAIDQVIDYALDLRNFHEGSHHANLIPVLIAEKASKKFKNNFQEAQNLNQAILLNAQNLREFFKPYNSTSLMDVLAWEQSPYKPTPTIIEAAQALYQNHDVAEITRSDAGAKNLSATANCISNIIEQAKQGNKKAICFVTGVPGAGKTLAGLNIANQRLKVAEDEHTVFLSGNGPLVQVLQEALARDSVIKNKIKKENALKATKAFIQNIHHFRDEYLENSQAPTEKVVVFDEAQRAWNQHQTCKFMRQKRGRPDFNKSEPEFLIEVMNRHQDWCVIVCLIGGGQEINTGEAGLVAWMQALKSSYIDWQVHYSNLIVNQDNYLQDTAIKNWLSTTGVKQNHLHLATSVRSFRSEKVSAWVHALLDIDEQAKSLWKEIKSNYPIVLTRDLQKAKAWVKAQAKGSERYGLVASSGARRLKALGVHVKNEIDVANWFLNPKDDVRSSYFLEDVATEFDVQGLELDWVCLAWGENFYYQGNQWYYQSFKGCKWQNINKEEDKQFTQNAYRVLLTRARQGMVVWIPEGSESDNTRQKKFYDGTYQYLKSIGIDELV
ncbi:hypothetical protein HMPREF3047_07965 [Neisseria sp. HMSC075C10]|mgnify:FL=1|jgi:hypothetical protein|uniref:DUF2075 domain-containing protein n=1 Tax=unclassified Neisseria TaxID=2623750 RepID=UPI0008A3D476|nr:MULTISPECIES: DUF2075 domain-containing protein [unclassified Neisseria]OFO38086.1 hypothetical protein HMPREF3047_07965 [Neisseria sp. HMSC075C10]OHQ58978.1 hypothetical protein HMPREF2606_04935 [Neisseria sp. HMSC070H10]